MYVLMVLQLHTYNNIHLKNERLLRVALQVEVICELKLILVVEMEWFKGECSACYREIEIVDGEYRCIICNRELPFAEKK